MKLSRRYQEMKQYDEDSFNNYSNDQSLMREKEWKNIA